jgi:hypothetical protein
LILKNVPIPIPVDILTTWKELCDAGPLDVLAARGVVPLDYAGMARALPERFADATKVKDWFQYRWDARERLKRILGMARDFGAVALCEFSGISHRETSMEDSTKLMAYRYRRAGARQSNFVLVNGTIHAAARPAVEAMLGQVEQLRPAGGKPRRRPRRQPSSSDEFSSAILAQLGFEKHPYIPDPLPMESPARD